MNLVVIFGPEAVGKMSVGHELATLTGMKLFHNHRLSIWPLTFSSLAIPALIAWSQSFGRQSLKKLPRAICRVLFLPSRGRWI
jgi:hypothetical protein